MIETQRRPRVEGRGERPETGKPTPSTMTGPAILSCEAVELVKLRDGRAELRTPAGPIWVCFYCGEICRGRKEAENHFGLDSWEDFDAACVSPLRTDEKERAAVMMECERELEGEREAGAKLAADLERLDNEIANLRAIEPELLRALKAATPGEARHNLDFLEGRALAAEAIVGELKARAPDLFRAIQDHVCRPTAAR